MSARINNLITRRKFLQISGALAAATAVTNPCRVLYALTRDKGEITPNEIREVFSACRLKKLP